MNTHNMTNNVCVKVTSMIIFPLFFVFSVGSDNFGEKFYSKIFSTGITGSDGTLRSSIFTPRSMSRRKVFLSSASTEIVLVTCFFPLAEMHVADIEHLDGHTVLGQLQRILGRPLPPGKCAASRRPDR